MSPVAGEQGLPVYILIWRETETKRKADKETDREIESETDAWRKGEEGSMYRSTQKKEIESQVSLCLWS